MACTVPQSSSVKHRAATTGANRCHDRECLKRPALASRPSTAPRAARRPQRFSIGEPSGTGARGGTGRNQAAPVSSLM